MICSATFTTVFIFMLLYTPSGFHQPQPIVGKEVSIYLTHVLSPKLYNGAQLQEPFDLEVTEEGINDIVARSDWPKQSQSSSFLTPEVSFEQDTITIIGAVILKGVRFLVTIEIEPAVNGDGLLDLAVTKVGVGAVNITLPARIIATKMYRHQSRTTEVNSEETLAKIAGALLDGQPFEPVFRVKENEIRVESVKIIKNKLTIAFVPAG